jgi:zinc protease
VAVTAGRRRVVIALAALAGITCGTTGPPPPPLRLLPVQQHTLRSGLRVVIERDEASGVAGVVLTVDVGSVDDPPGRHGMAHTLEHLAFRAPDETGRSMHARLVRLGAASFNGGTALERTTYWAFGPQHALDEVLAVVLGRLADPLKGIDDELFAKESAVVAEEMRKQEGAAGMEALMPVLLPPAHPHARAHAERRETPPLSLAEMRTFAERFYRPERMTLLISSPTPIDLQQQLAGKLPPAWQGRTAEPRAAIRRPMAAFDAPAPAASDLPTRETVAVIAPELWMAWRVPPAVGIAAGRLEVVARVVHRMLSRRLDPDGTNDVLDVAAWAVPGRLASAVVCRFKLRAPTDAVRIRNETKGALEALADVTLIHGQPRLRSSYDNAVTEAILRTTLGMDSVKERTKMQVDLAHAEGGAHIAQLLDALSRIAIDDIADFVGRYLKPDAARAVLLVPEKIRDVTHARSRLTSENENKHESEEPSGAEAATEAEPGAETPPAPPGPGPELQAIVAAPGARAALVRRLSNGLSVIVMRRPGLPFVSMILGFHADPQPGDAPGARIPFDHALGRNLLEGPLERGILRVSKLDGDDAQESLTMFARQLDQGLDLLADEGETLRVFWPNPAFDRWVDREALREVTPDAQAARAFRTALYGDHAYRLRPTAEAARTLTERQAQAWFQRVRRPANGVLIIVGDIAPEAAVQSAEKLLSGWRGDAAAPPPPPAALSPDAGLGRGAQLLYTNDPRRRSSTVRFGCIAPPVRTPRDRIVHQVLAGLIKANVYTRLRLGKGVTYGYDVDAESLRGGTAVIRGHVDVEGTATPDAVDVLRDWFDGARPAPITAKRFEQQRWNKARRSGLMNATGQQLARSLFNAWNMGWEPAVLDDYARDLASVTQKDVEAALDTCRKGAVISVLGPGPSPGGTGP